MIEFKTLPKGWTIARLEEVCGILDGKRKPINATERANRIDGKNIKELYPYYGATGQVGLIDDFLLDGEFVLLGEDGAPFLDPFKNKSYLVRGKVWVNNHAHVLKSYFNNQYLNHYLNIVNYRNHVTGTTRLKLNQSAMKGISIPIAPLPEQIRILAKLEQLLTGLDKGIEYLKTAQQQLKTYRQAVLKWAFEGNWEIKPLGKVAIVKRGKSKHRPRNAPELFGGKYPFIQTGDVRAANGRVVKEYRETYSEFGLQQSKLWPKGTLCLTIAANIADTAFLGFDACFPDSVVGITSDPNVLILDYVNFYIQKIKQEIEGKASATAQKNINVEFLEALEIPIPSPIQQLKIVQNIESRLSVCDKIEETIANGLQQAEALRLSIIKKAFEGKLVPQDPNDESAEKLLERIKLEKLKKEQLKKGKNKSGGKIKRIS